MRALLLLIAPAAFAQATSLEKITWRDAEAWRITDGKTEAIVVPAFGGRLMHYARVGGENWLWNGPADAKDTYMRWGGDKTFIGPHTMWQFTMAQAWPPPAPDFTAYEVKVDGQKLTTKSIPWENYSGAQISRTYSFNTEGELVITHAISKAPSTLPACVWIITQCVPATAYVPLNPQSAYKDNVFWFDGPKTDVGAKVVSPTLMEINPVIGKGFKIGADPKRPMLAAVRGKELFLQKAQEFKDGAQYPEGADGAGMSVEYYQHSEPPPRQYIELELLSPLGRIQDGMEFATRWSIQTYEGEAKKAVEHLFQE
jgi:hypothetical protein